MPATIGDVIVELTTAFADAGLDSPRIDARVLVAHVLDLDPSMLFARSTDRISDVETAAIQAVKKRRLAHEPVARIRGYREFHGAAFTIGPATLEPRADSETLVDAALALRALYDSRPVRILDLGTGTGCLLLAIIKEWLQADGVGIDISPEAVEVARRNSVRLGVAGRARFQVGDWCAELVGPFDMIISNPPYIAHGAIAGLAPEVSKYDPLLALDGGSDGLAAYRRFLPHLPPLLAPDGIVLLEAGIGQADAVGEMCAANGLPQTVFHRDLASIERVVQASPY